MRGVNKVILIGNLGADPEMRYFQDGTAVCNFNVATTESWNDRQSGERKEKTEWHRVSVFRRLAEICGQYLRKGSKVYIEGKLQTRSYEKDGQTRYITEIVCNEMQMLDSRGGQQGGGFGGGAPQGGYGGQPAGGGFGGGAPQGGYGGQPAGGGFGGNAPQQGAGGFGGGASQPPAAPQGGGFQSGAQPGNTYDTGGFGGGDFATTPPDDDIPF